VKIFIRKKGQSTLEYAVVIAVVVAALVAMQAYVKRGLQGKLRASTDEIGDQFSPNHTGVYHNSNSHVSSTENVYTSATSNPITYSTSNQSHNTFQHDTVNTLNNEDWVK
jgi:uncharacterized protein (UPF0333 family)